MRMDEPLAADIEGRDLRVSSSKERRSVLSEKRWTGFETAKVK